MRHYQWPDGYMEHGRPNITMRWDEQRDTVEIQSSSIDKAKMTYDQAKALYQMLSYLFGPNEG